MMSLMALRMSNATTVCMEYLLDDLVLDVSVHDDNINPTFHNEDVNENMDIF
jgi:hypothetical protein